MERLEYQIQNLCAGTGITVEFIYTWQDKWRCTIRKKEAFFASTGDNCFAAFEKAKNQFARLGRGL